MSIWNDTIDQLLMDDEEEDFGNAFFLDLLEEREREIQQLGPGRQSSAKRRKYHVKNWDEAPWMKLLAKLRELPEADRNMANREFKFFRRRFRLPYPLFLKLVEVFKRFKWLGAEIDCCGQRAAPYELKILSTLRILGRGVCFDNNFDGSTMEPETVRVAFHSVCYVFKKYLFREYVVPEDGEELRHTLSVYKRIGFPGAVASFDVVHVWWNKTPASLRSSCKGKENYTSIGYEVACTHTKKATSVMDGSYGADNDKSTVRYDNYVMDIHEERMYQDVEFELMNEDGDFIREKGGYLLNDNGYHKWRATQCPLKHTLDPHAAKWSAQLESVRKDVEGLFGIMKVRWRFLKNPIELHHLHEVNNAVHTCFVLHNMLLEYDGLDKKWYEENDPDGEVDPEYDGERAHHDAVNARAVNRVRGARAGVVEIPPAAPIEDAEVHGDHFVLQRKLIEHFKQQWNRNQIRWLS